ncbi:MAG TPA: 16S rRNA (adenine(1518)-N(6)/adenine(1519)-N(6))-dimethyltransferase RsmA, partial [Pyrinomonadaceae bacterium]|nr:16S rRNA (adenine(1518)-N(6)/adenine(1519)-N(6))-dimethyltransferase RsmA [Pyrinomonadaceae bacterium]
WRKETELNETKLTQHSLITCPRPPVAPFPRLSHSPSKRLGQHFLIDQRVIDRIIKSLNPTPDETIVEIGPGRGALTTELVAKAGRVIAVELDRNLVPLLMQHFGSLPNFKLVQSDALITDFCSEILPSRQARLVANLPYNISTAILQRLIEQRHCLPKMVLMLQREVVDRITAPAGSTDRGYLSVFVEAYCESEKLFDVAPGAFRPAPKVWSTVIRLRPRPRLGIPVKDEDLLWQVVSAGFAQRRKTILNNLRNAPGPLAEIVKNNGGASIVLCQAEIDLQRRAETLTLTEWARIVHVIE